MKVKSLLLFAALCLSGYLSAATITITTSAPTGSGSITEALTTATTGDVIDFNFDGSEITLTDVLVIKSITINGSNSYNGTNVTLKQSTPSKGFFSLASGINGTFQNLIFDGSGVLGNTAITAANGSTLTISGCVFRNINAQANNGAVARIQGAATISGSAFEGNSTSGSYGGGAICVYNAAVVSIDKCSFIGNTSIANGNSGGGAIVSRGTVATACNVSITNSTFANNASGKTGGAILSSVQSSSVYTSNVTAVNCTFTGNQGDGAISSLVTSKGTANVYLANSIVLNNVDAAASSYSDLLETNSASGTVLVEPHNVIYSVASGTVVTSGRNCIQILDPGTANVFKSMETFATNKKRAELAKSGLHTVAMISSGSLALNAGVASLSGYAIPTVDQLGFSRPATPSVGAVEYNDLNTGTEKLTSGDFSIKVNNRDITVNGINAGTKLSVYNFCGYILYHKVVNNGDTISLENQPGNVFIVKAGTRTIKVILM